MLICCERKSPLKNTAEVVLENRANIVTMLIHFASQTRNNIHQVHISTERNIQDNEEHHQLASSKT
jgi:hypothetical protein